MICIRCGIEKEIDAFPRRGRGEQRRTICKVCHAAERAEYRALNRDRILEVARIYRELNRLEIRRYQREYKRQPREQILEAYGRRCNCCGEDEERFLTLDHINGGGNKHHKLRGNSGVYRDVVKAGFPKDLYQLLCYNCNMGRAVNGGVCPHQQAGK